MSFFFSLNAKISGLAWWIILIFSVHIYLDRIKLFTEGFFEIQNIFWMRAFYWPKIALFARPRQHSQWKLKKNFFFNISKNPSVKSLIFIFCLIIKNKFSKTFFSFSDFAPQKWPKTSFSAHKPGCHGNRTGRNGKKIHIFVKGPKVFKLHHKWLTYHQNTKIM